MKSRIVKGWLIVSIIIGIVGFLFESELLMMIFLLGTIVSLVGIFIFWPAEQLVRQPAEGGGPTRFEVPFAELCKELARAKTPDKCYSVYRKASEGSDIELQALAKMYTLLSEHLSKAVTTADCMRVLDDTIDNERPEFDQKILEKAAATARTVREALSISDLEVDDNTDESAINSFATQTAILRAAEIIRAESPTIETFLEDPVAVS